MEEMRKYGDDDDDDDDDDSKLNHFKKVVQKIIDCRFMYGTQR